MRNGSNVMMNVEMYVIVLFFWRPKIILFVETEQAKT